MDLTPMHKRVIALDVHQAICPGNNESAGKRKTGRIRKGNAWVRRLLCEFAQASARTRCALKAKFDALAIRKGHKSRSVALDQDAARSTASSPRLPPPETRSPRRLCGSGQPQVRQRYAGTWESSTLIILETAVDRFVSLDKPHEIKR